MAWDVCPQIFAQSRRRWSSNWYSSHLAEFQSINYLRRFSEVIECNCDSFALINRMQMPRWVTQCRRLRRPAVWKLFQRRKRMRTPSARIFIALLPFLSSARSLSFSPAFPFSPAVTDSLSDALPPVSSRSKSNMTARTVDIMENVRRERYCTHTNSRGLNWTALAVTRTLPEACRMCHGLYLTRLFSVKPPSERKPPETCNKTDKKGEPWPIAGRVSALSLIN